MSTSLVYLYHCSSNGTKLVTDSFVDRIGSVAMVRNSDEWWTT